MLSRLLARVAALRGLRADFIAFALGRHGVLRFPDQQLDERSLREFSERFGEIQGPSTAPESAYAAYAHAGTLTNLRKNGKRQPGRDPGDAPMPGDGGEGVRPGFPAPHARPRA